MPAAVVGGNVRYPSLQAIADLFRSSINDDFEGATGTPGEGLIATNRAPFMLTFMNAAIRDVYSDLRNVGDPSLILDNYILTGLPALTTPDPTVQVSLAYAGFFDGYQWHANWTLPVSCNKVLRLWERISGSDDDFTQMTQAPNGLPGVQQWNYNRMWEMRQNAVWMPGTLVSVDLRVRCRITFPDFLDPTTIDFTTAYVPIVDSQNAIEAKMRRRYASRFAPDMKADAIADEKEYMGKLQLEVVRQQQSAESQRAAFGEEATFDFTAYNQL